MHCTGIRRALVALSLALAAAAPARAQIGGCTPNLTGSLVYVIETPLGDIPVQLYPNMAPQTVANFRNYADSGDWDGSLVHRSVPGFVIQGGGYREVGGAYQTIPTDPPIPNEPCLTNTTGTIAMARLGGQPNSATSQWFINLANNTTLNSTDGVGFTAFGRVIGNGMSVVQNIAAMPIFDALAYLQLPFNQIFRSLPLFALPVDPPGGYGCSRASPIFGLYAEPPATGFIVDPTRHSASATVPILLDRQCTGAGATGPPDVPCTTTRSVYEINLATQQIVSGPYSMSCSAVSESEDSWAARRTGTNNHLRANDLAVISVPEPSTDAMLVAGAIALALLAPRRRARSPR